MSVLPNPDRPWKRVEGSLIFGNLALEKNAAARIVVCKSRKEFDSFLIREGIAASDIDWGRA